MTPSVPSDLDDELTSQRRTVTGTAELGNCPRPVQHPFMRALLLLLLSLPLSAVDWKAGAEQPLQTEHLPKPARIFLPENWTAERTWPAIFFYPWTGGPADISMMRQHTGGRDFIIVGMPPRDDGPFTYTPETFTLEQTALREMRKQLAADVRLDPARVFVAGFSKGGWLSGLLLAHEPGLAGACVMGGGWIQHQHAAPQTFKTPVYLYIGDGRLDGNFPPSLRASQEFAKLGARVTFDIWPDKGHALPEGGSEGLRQWLALIARGADARNDAAKWVEPEFARINALSDPIAQWYELRRFANRPFTRALGDEWSKRVVTRLGELERQPAIAAEAALDRELTAIHQREIQDMKVTTLEAVGPRYEALAARAPDSPAGKLAKHDAGRIKKLWETVPKAASAPPRPGSPQPISPSFPDPSRSVPKPPTIRGR
jgi:predicted esterase